MNNELNMIWNNTDDSDVLFCILKKSLRLGDSENQINKNNILKIGLLLLEQVVCVDSIKKNLKISELYDILRSNITERRSPNINVSDYISIKKYNYLRVPFYAFFIIWDIDDPLDVKISDTAFIARSICNFINIENKTKSSIRICNLIRTVFCCPNINEIEFIRDFCKQTRHKG